MSKKAKPAAPGTETPIAPLRETAVYALTFPTLLGVVREAAQLIFNVILEAARNAPPLREAPVRAKLRAVAQDLRFLERFLHAAGEDPDERDFAEDGDLLDWALVQAREVARIAVRIERRIGPPPALEA